MNIESLSETLIREIENRMPARCKIVKKWYKVKLENTPKMQCMWCRIGMHDCTEMDEMTNNPGIK